jgi:hypothetical protein
MTPANFMEVSLDYVSLMSVLSSVSIGYSKDHSNNKLYWISTIFPVGIFPLSSAILIFVIIFTPYGIILNSQNYVILTVTLFWLTSCLMLYRKLFNYFTVYQVTCLFVYFQLVEIFGFQYAKQIILYLIFCCLLGLLVLIRFSKVINIES